MGGSNGRNGIRIYYCRNVAGGRTPAALAKLELRHDVLLEAVPCSGRLDPRYLLKAFESGARAVCVLACPRGQCKSMEGNLRAIARVQAAAELLVEAGLDPRSVQIFLPEGSEESALNEAVERIAECLAERQTGQELVRGES